MSRKNLYLTLSDQLEQYLSVLPEGKSLPSEQELADRFRVSKPTLRKAMDLLRSEGLIHTRNGVGNSVGKTPAGFRKELVFVCSDLVFFADTLKYFSIELADSNYLCSVIPLSGSVETQKRILRSVFQRKAAGIVLYAGNLEADQSEIIPECSAVSPVLHLVRRHFDLEGDLLQFRNEEGMCRIIKHFYRQGARRFALFGHRVNTHAFRERLQGFTEGLRKVRLLLRQELVCGKKEDYESFFANFNNERTRPDAVCCMNDRCAGDLFYEMKKRNIACEQLLISGFDCSDAACFYPKSICSVKLPLAELGIRAAQLMIRRIANPSLGVFSEKLSPELVDTDIINL